MTQEDISPNDNAKPAEGFFTGWTDLALAFMMLRLWLGLRWLIAGIEKFEYEGVLSMENYTNNMNRIASGISSEAVFPFPEWITKIYAMGLGYEQILLGLLILAGVKLRIMMTLNTLFYISLSFGMMAVASSEGIAWLGTHMVLSVGAMLLVKHQKWAAWRD